MVLICATHSDCGFDLLGYADTLEHAKQLIIANGWTFASSFTIEEIELGTKHTVDVTLDNGTYWQLYLIVTRAKPVFL